MSAIPSIRDELLRRLANLSPEAQEEVLQLARSLNGLPMKSGGHDGDKWKKFVGILSDKEAAAMMGAIEAGCERIDPNEW